MKVNLPNRQRLLVIVTGAVLGLYVLDAVVVEPLYRLWQVHSLEITKLRKSVADGRATVTQAARITRHWQEMQENALPKDAAEAQQEVIAAFSRWSSANNVELSSIRPQWKRGATDRYSLLECRIDASGTMASLSRFLYELERSPMALRVDTLEVTSRDDGGSKLALGLIVSGLRLAPLERKPR